MRKEPEERKQEIIDTMVKLCHGKSYPAVTAQELADAIPCSRPLIYYYFTNLNGVIRETLRYAKEVNDKILINQGTVNKHELFS